MADTLGCMEECNRLRISVKAPDRHEDMKPRIRRHAIKILAALSSLIIIVLACATWSLWNRIALLERTVAHREAADPLIPEECPHADWVCVTSIGQVVKSPEKYHGREIGITGIFVSGFETSILVDKTDRGEGQGIWVNDGIPVSRNLQEMTVVGRFKRGPSGHLGGYKGELSEVRIVGGSK